MRNLFSARLVVGCVVACLAISLAAPSRADATTTTGVWIRPVGGRVVRAFDPPRSRFGAGHLGVDLASTPGTRVRAAAAGVVVFAGSVAGTLHVVVAHAGNLRTSYSFLATILVDRGERVAGGEVVGTTGGIGEEHDGSVLHLGLRLEDTYVDPMQLFRPLDLAALVHLAPTLGPRDPASARNERRGLLAGFVHGIAAVGALARGAYDAVGGALASAGGWASDGVAGAGRVAARTLASALTLQAGTIRAVAEWLRQHGHCDAHAPPADGEGGSDHRVMLVAGIDSRLNGGRTSMHLPVQALGYRPDEVNYFSYARAGGDYRPSATEGSLLAAARRLGEQLRDLERRDPGREVDLLAHSQGGVVVEAFLTLVYDPTDASYPPLGTVVTLSSPLTGDPLASAAEEIARSRAGRELLRRARVAARRSGQRLPPPDAAAVRDLASDSRLMRRLNAAHLPDEVDLTAIGSATDVVVPGNVSSRSGARGTVLVPWALDAHNGILNDPAALRAVRAALENRPLPCRSLATILAGELIPTTITMLERDAGDAVALAGRAVDAAS